MLDNACGYCGAPSTRKLYLGNENNTEESEVVFACDACFKKAFISKLQKMEESNG